MMILMYSLSQIERETEALVPLRIQYRMKLLYRKVPSSMDGLTSHPNRPVTRTANAEGKSSNTPLQPDRFANINRSVFGGTSQPGHGIAISICLLEMIYLTQTPTYIWYSGAHHLAHIHFIMGPHTANK